MTTFKKQVEKVLLDSGLTVIGKAGGTKILGPSEPERNLPMSKTKTIGTTTDDATTLDEIRTQWDFIVKECDSKVESCKEALKEAKEEREAALVRLGEIINDGERPLLEGSDE